jgi:hypothetical protein
MASIVHLPTAPGARAGTFVRNGNIVLGLVSEQRAAAAAAAAATAGNEEKAELLAVQAR